MNPSVVITPGLRELTRIFRGPSSLDSTLVIASTAALLAEEITDLAGATVFTLDPILMMLPPSAGKRGSAAFVVKSNPRMYDAWIGGTPMARMGEVDEIASVVLFLASEAASLMTGSVVVVDGGYTCW